MTTELTTITKAKANTLCEHIRERLGDICVMVTQLHHGRGWAVLGYDSWDSCVQQEFGRSKRWANLLIATEEVRKQIAPGSRPSGGKSFPTGDNTPRMIPDSHMQALMPLPDDERADIYQAVLDEAGEKPPTAKAVTERVKTVLADNEKPIDTAFVHDDETVVLENPLLTLRTAIMAARRQVDDMNGLPEACYFAPAACKVALHRAARFCWDAVAAEECPRCFGEGCDYCRQGLVTKSMTDTEDASEAQKALLAKMGQPSDVPKAEASRLITAQAVAEQWKIK